MPPHTTQLSPVEGLESDVPLEYYINDYATLD